MFANLMSSLCQECIKNDVPDSTERSIYFAYSELCKWLGSDGQLIAAIAFGYPNESPKERPRKKIDDIVEWRS